MRSSGKLKKTEGCKQKAQGRKKLPSSAFCLLPSVFFKERPVEGAGAPRGLQTRRGHCEVSRSVQLRTRSSPLQKQVNRSLTVLRYIGAEAVNQPNTAVGCMSGSKDS